MTSSSSESSAAEPDLQPAGRTPYVAYTNADVLRTLIHTETAEPLEVTFVVTTQIMELHFYLLAHEWRIAIAALDRDDVPGAVAALHRGFTVQQSLVSTWQMLDPMSPVEYNRFRDALGKASGFQSFGYRELEFLLGVKDERMLRPHADMPEVAAQLQKTFDEPSLYDHAIALLVRRQIHTGDLVEAWRVIYVAGGELAELAEALIGVADRHAKWRFVHYTAVRRILGSKPGTGGSAGMAWLKRAVDADVFSELWQVRSVL
jgi:tryptophan 2,3-dioxygenase